MLGIRCPGVMEGVPSARGYSGGFACDLMAKDLGIAVSSANSGTVPLLFCFGCPMPRRCSMSRHGQRGMRIPSRWDAVTRRFTQSDTRPDNRRCRCVLQQSSLRCRWARWRSSSTRS
eukprot:1850389-Rhodomonas_salina.5